MNKRIIKLLIVILVFSPVFSFAALTLENIYPTVPGTSLGLSSDSTLGEAIRYFSSWFIFIGAIIAFGSLIYAGVLYLSSIAKPAIMQEAQTRIFKSFLGLAILLGSYLILLTINPELIVMRTDRKPIVSGVLLLNTISTSNIQSPTGGRTVPEQIEKCISDGDAYYLTSDIKDVEKEFGRLIKKAGSTPPEVNFENFKVESIAFLERGGKNAKTIAYHEKDFSKQIDGAEEYIYEGRIDQSGDLITIEYPIPVAWIDDKGNPQIIQLIDLKFSSTKVKFTDTDSDPEVHFNEIILHPPLSFEVKNIWPGTYLYADNVGEERYLNSSEKDFSAINFNDSTKKISVHNEPRDEKDRKHDFLSILYEDKNFYDRFRMFFVRKERSMPGTPDNGNTWAYYENESTPGYISPGNLYNIEMGFPLIHTDNSTREPLEDPGQYTDQYGKVKKPSSAQIFEIDGDNPTACQEVRICTKPGFLGSCIVYTPLDGNHIEQVDLEEGVFIATSSDPDIATVLPIYRAKNIPIEMDVAKINETGARIVGISENKKFANNIFSIKITGNCLVALFQNEVKNRNMTNPDETFWDGKTPGNHSQIFTESVADLSNFEICRCGSLFGLGIFKYGNSCASSIAIFPLKK